MQTTQQAAPGQPVTQQQGQPVTTQVVVVQQSQPQQIDDACCIYVFAVFGFLIPLVGFIGMCVYNCGNNLAGPNQQQAFKVLVGCTIAGLIVGIIIGASS